VYADAKPVFDPMYLLIKVAATVILLIGWLALLAGLHNVIGATIWFASLVVLGMVLRQSQLTRQRVHLALVAAAAEKQIPLAPCIEAFGREQGGRFDLRARKLATDLRSGIPLGAAIARSPGVLPKAAELAARVGQECGRLGPALREEIVSQSESSALRNATAGRLIYVYIVLLSAPLITTFAMIKIVPSYQKIYSDFDVTMPAITTFVLRLAANPIVRGLLGISSLLATGMLCCGALWYIGWPPVTPPGLGRLLLRFDRGRILRALAFPAEQGRPLEPMIENLAAKYPRRGTRRRLRQAAEQIAGGHDWIATFRAHGLVAQVDAGVLQAAQRVGNLPWALREMAESNERRLLYRLEVLLQVGSIIMIVLFGFLTLLFCLAFFLPLVKLIRMLSY
jgi:type II secretory pathway component PulF